ncbi:MAG: AMP-binding protein [Deltaproteobacteria bacterium]
MRTDPETLKKELTYSRFDQMSEKYPDRPALIYLGERVSYRRLKLLSERFAGSLSSMGVDKGDRVMLYIPNCVQWVIAFLGIQKIGGGHAAGLEALAGYFIRQDPLGQSRSG